ncbi:TonB-dependent receptor [Sphingomonas sp. MMS24-J13]|uniref:TonB-dependent receptor n=1 Tax=Sphingomonas sp. MMS24-J13 TaxID=3238686 RepID=UPI00384FBBA0
MAQNAETPHQGAASAKVDQLGDIVVTARFVSEKLQDTPIAITAQTNAQLEAAHVTNVGTLGAVVPNLQTIPGDSQSAGTPKIRMRGIIQGESSSIAVPPAVAIYTDDVYHATTAGSELDFTDLDHVEVNRGPQSTLSGNASIGGSIKLYTKDPVGNNSGYLSFEGGSRKKLGANGAIDLGISPTLAIRVSGNFERQDGFEQRLDFTCEMQKLGTPALAGTLPLAQPDSAARDCVLGRLGGYNHTTGQVKLRWRPTEKLDIILTARKHIERDEETPEVALSYQPNPNPNTTNALVETYNIAVRNAFGIQLDSRFVAPPGTGGYATYATNCRPNINIQPNGFCFDRGKQADHALFSGKIHYDITDDIHLTGIGAYTKYSNAFTQNGDQSPFGYVVSHFTNQDNQGSGEVRLDGKLFDNRLNWVVGGYLLRLDGYQKNSINFLTTSQQSVVHGTNNSQSGFFHLDFNITPRWRVSGGARYTDGTIKITINNPTAVSVIDPVKSVQHRWDWLISTDYKITDNILAYANAATGSRPPGLTTIVNTARQLSPTPAEDLISYETGLKAEWFERRLRTNLSAFYTDYKSLATSVQGYECVGQTGATAIWYPTPASCQQYAPNTGNVQYFINAAIPAKIYGAEWDITLVPIEGLRLDWTGGYNHFKSGIKTVGQPGYLFPGNHRQPIWNMHADASYAIQTPIGSFTPRIDWSWQSQQDYDPSAQSRAPLPVYIIKPYSLWNAQIAYETDDRKWSATLSVANLADKFYRYQVLQGTLDAQTRLAPPREITLSVRRVF